MNGAMAQTAVEVDNDLANAYAALNDNRAHRGARPFYRDAGWLRFYHPTLTLYLRFPYLGRAKTMRWATIRYGTPLKTGEENAWNQ